MAVAESTSTLEAIHLAARPGRRLCIHRRPVGDARGCVLYVHPFAEEMNKSRRMAALQARRLAESGYAVLLVDLYGCGDSDGDFADARWDIWLEDLACARDWLSARWSCQPVLWGLRLGATLAMDFARCLGDSAGRALLWSPVVDGEQFLTQFLRLKVASEMLGRGQAGSGTRDLRAALAAGEALEIAGYALGPDLARAIDRVRLAELAPAGWQVDWIELVAEAGRPAPPGQRRCLDAWGAAGVAGKLHVTVGDPFWATQEITECLPLLDLTTALLKQ